MFDLCIAKLQGSHLMTMILLDNAKTSTDTCQFSVTLLKRIPNGFVAVQGLRQLSVLLRQALIAFAQNTELVVDRGHRLAE